MASPARVPDPKSGPKTPDPAPIRFLGLKKALIRFAEWHGWIRDYDEKAIASVLRYENPKPLEAKSR